MKWRQCKRLHTVVSCSSLPGARAARLTTLDSHDRDIPWIHTSSGLLHPSGLLIASLRAPSLAHMPHSTLAPSRITHTLQQTCRRHAYTRTDILMDHIALPSDRGGPVAGARPELVVGLVRGDRIHFNGCSVHSVGCRAQKRRERSVGLPSRLAARRAARLCARSRHQELARVGGEMVLLPWIQR